MDSKTFTKQDLAIFSYHYALYGNVQVYSDSIPTTKVLSASADSLRRTGKAFPTHMPAFLYNELHFRGLNKKERFYTVLKIELVKK